jgi:hypothetical protein
MSSFQDAIISEEPTGATTIYYNGSKVEGNFKVVNYYVKATLKISDQSNPVSEEELLIGSSKMINKYDGPLSHQGFVLGLIGILTSQAAARLAEEPNLQLLAVIDDPIRFIHGGNHEFCTSPYQLNRSYLITFPPSSPSMTIYIGLTPTKMDGMPILRLASRVSSDDGSDTHVLERSLRALGVQYREIGRDLIFQASE